MSQKTGLGKNQINNKYLVELEIHRFIVNQFNKSIKGNKQNDIIIIPQDIRDTDSDYREDCFVRNSVNRDRRELMARKIGVTIREEAKYLAMLEYATDEEKKEYYRLKEIHLVFAIKYFYDELYIQLKNRIEEKYVDNIQTSNVDIFGGYYDAKNYKEKKKKVVDIIIEDNIKEIC